ncbi:MAG: methyltransferase domain-containing protein [Alphaproteobacteria bacterium]|nr:methyltransferase domain-containing protein [Alphaproteobacteria bacterium]
MNPNKALWEKGDFTRIAAAMREGGEALVASLALAPGTRVLDLGCGDGTTAIPAAQRGADVLGVDIASNLVEAGARRAQALGLSNCRFQLGDAFDLSDLPGDAFDVVVSIFGAMFAPRPDDVAAAMLRVVKPGGRIVMGNWIPNDPTLVAQILRISSAYAAPPPPGFVSPMTWGDDATVTARFVKAGAAPDAIAFSRETYVFDHAGPPDSFVDLFERFYGPTMNAFDAAAAAGKADALRSELRALFARENTSPTPDRTVIPARFLKVEVRKP